MDEDEKRFADGVAAARKRKGWSQGELARRMIAEGWAKYSQMTVRRTENHERPVRLGEARALAQVLNSTVEDLIEPPLTLANHAAVTRLTEVVAKLEGLRRLYGTVVNQALSTLREVADLIEEVEADRPFSPAEVEQEVERLLGICAGFLASDAARLMREGAGGNFFGDADSFAGTIEIDYGVDQAKA